MTRVALPLCCRSTPDAAASVCVSQSVCVLTCSSLLQCYPIEKAAKESSLPWTIVRLPIFVDNIW